jgi:peptidoglycan hydrolase-like protein with peptidoglycan-binding domain
MQSASPAFRPNVAYICLDLRDLATLRRVRELSLQLNAKGYNVSTTPVDGLPAPDISIGATHRIGLEKMQEYVNQLQRAGATDPSSGRTD